VATRIAVVNDERDFLEMVRLLLEEEGYEVRACSDGLGALSLVKEWHPNLVLLDIRMAGLSGWEILEQMAGDAATKDVRVLVTSGATEEVSAARADLRRRGHDFIPLPFDVDQLLSKVEQMAGRP
jgi:CheY-like chemotaxis protein